MLKEFLGQTFISRDKSCPYLSGETSATQYYIGCVDDAAFAKLLERGWRRFGRLFFRPVCSACAECKSVRVDPDQFEWSKSFRRVLNKGERLRLKIARPSITDDRLKLYDEYHKERSTNRGWDAETTSSVEYYSAFVERSGNYEYEFSYYYLDRLVCVALVDMLPMGISAVYCYYDPDMRALSLGTYSILRQLLFAKDRRLKRFYLGYWARGNDSLSYKTRFKPYETLRGRPALDQSPVWE
ncbi:MAG: arginyltransferase [Helicobacteraceae bacterium]|jgi:arginine-tRNA-protein transferase|nr:arginyltransferase [Helicobacteraceae bacterium]